MDEEKGMVDMLVEPTVEVEGNEMEEEISLKDMIAEIVKEVMATMKSEVMKEEEVETEMAQDEDVQSEYQVELANYKQEIETLKSQLREFENKEKFAMIEKFSMLDASFIEEVKANIDSYSVDQLEAKLSIEAVRSGLVFSAKQPEVSTYTINDFDKNSAPSWITALEKI